MKPILVYVGNYIDRPSGIEELADELRRLHPRQFENLPIMCSLSFWTNHPSVVNQFGADYVIVCHKGRQAPLSDHPDWPRWKRELKPGEFWSIVGESWVEE